MMINVLGIVGSPRKKGNTHQLVAKILEGAASGGAAVHYVFLSGLSMKECDGCHVCWLGKECSKHDDMNHLYLQINQADVLVLGTPVYWYGPTALMKGFMDRFVYYNCDCNRRWVKGKKVLLAIPFEDANRETAEPVEQFFERSLSYLEMNLAGKIVAGGLSSRGQAASREDLMKAAFMLGKNMINADKAGFVR
ncbi:MAG: flavodoxin family protein [Veillonellales bacterium]